MDKACKEMGMEKFLHDCKNNWKGLEFDYEDHTSGQTGKLILLFRLNTSQASS